MFEIKKINKKIYQKRYAMLWQFGHFVTLGKMTFWTYCHHGHNIFWAFYHPGHFVILGLNVIWAFWLWAICHTWAFCHLGHFNIQSKNTLTSRSLCFCGVIVGGGNSFLGLSCKNKLAFLAIDFLIHWYLLSSCCRSCKELDKKKTNRHWY